jgi:hypothetical protein
VNKNEPSFSFDVNEPSDILNHFLNQNFIRITVTSPFILFLPQPQIPIHNSLINLASAAPLPKLYKQMIVEKYQNHHLLKIQHQLYPIV